MSSPPELATLTREPPPRRLTFEEFLDWCDEDTRAEWVDGVVEVMSPGSRRHQLVLQFIFRLVADWVEAGDLGEVHSQQFLMRLPRSLRRGRMPDVLYVAKANMHRFRDTYVDGPADLAGEVVSTESIERDLVHKLQEYEAGGVPEYWIVWPDGQHAEFRELGPDGRYQVIHAGHTGRYRSRVLPGFWLDLEWFWQEPLPSRASLLREMGM